MLSGNADTEDAAKEYYPAYTKTDGTKSEVINTLGLDLSDNGPAPSTEGSTYTVSFNGSDIESPTGFFTYGDGKHNFNTKFTGTYDGLQFNQGLKMEGTTVIAFTTTATATVTIVQSVWSTHSLKFDDQELTAASATTPTGSQDVRVYTLAGVAPGSHEIRRGSGESGVFYVAVVSNGATGISAATTDTRTNTRTNTQRSLGGRPVTAGYKGVVIKDGRKVMVRP